LTARYSKTSSGYMGQLIEWPEAVTEGEDIEDCREALKDAVEQMVLVYREQDREIPIENALFESFPVSTDVG
jgi:predicted RNase H-like HicB family nuclease